MKIVAWSACALVVFLAGLFGGAWISRKGMPNASDIYIAEVGSAIDLLYDRSGHPRDAVSTRDALLLKLANSLVLAGNAPDNAAIDGNAQLLKTYTDVKQVDARQMAEKVATCVSKGEHDGVCP